MKHHVTRSVLATALTLPVAIACAGASDDAAVFVLGQPDGTSNAKRLSISCPTDIVRVGEGIAVADTCNHRVLVWRSIPATASVEPDLVLGQPDLSTSVPNYGGLSARSLHSPLSIASDGTRLFVADRNQRVLVWTSLPTDNYAPADLVLGQPDFTSDVGNEGGVSAESLYDPAGVFTDGTRLLVADRGNSRVLIWNTLPTTQRQPADVVVGQPDASSTGPNTGGIGAATLNEPLGRPYSDGVRLFVADSLNNRVLVWSAIPTRDGAPATFVLGQPDMTSTTANEGGVSAESFSRPVAVHGDGESLAVADNLNHRVLVWSSSSTIGARTPADIALGQPSLTSGGLADSIGNNLYEPASVFLDGDGAGSRLLVADRFHHRALLFTPLPMVTGAPPNVVLGQPSVDAGNLYPPSADRYDAPAALALIGDRFALADGHRVLFWGSPPAGASDLPAMVLGEPDLTTRRALAPADARTLCGARSVTTDGTRLFVADLCHHRVLIWSSLPTANHEPADIVVGQPDMTSGEPNSGGVSAATMIQPSSAVAVGDRLFVADTFNHRVLVWNTLPSANGAPADLVLGQPDLVSNVANEGGVSARSLSLPAAIASDGTRLFVADGGNNRVLVWNALPTASHQPADLVVGQPDMVTVSPGTSPTKIGRPTFLLVHDGRLYVSDRENNRVLVWSALPTVNGEAAAMVVGQLDMYTGLANHGGLSERTLQSPSGLAIAGRTLYVSDEGNARIVARPVP